MRTTGSTWKTASDDIVRVHWYEGDAAFGAKALKLGADEVRETSKLLGVTETDPIDFFVYASVDDFYGAIGPGAHENVAGSAYANIRTLLGLIPPDQINDSWSAVRIPHEFVHLVFDTASKNPYHSPPRWLNEGLAVYQSEGYGTGDRSAVDQAARGGTLIPLDGLTGQFPNGQDFFLAYSESVSAVEFMVRTYGPDALVTLIRSYADGRNERRGVQRCARARHDGLRQRLVQGREGDPQDQVRATAGATRPRARCLERGRARPTVWTGSEPRQRGGLDGPPERGARPRHRWRPGGSDGSTIVGVVVAIGVIVLIVAAALAVRRRRASPTLAVIAVRRLRAIPTWQVTLGVALLALGFLIAAQLASEGPRVRYTTQERTPLVETVNELQTQQDALKARILDLRAQIQVVEGQGEGSAVQVRQLNERLQQARIAAGLIPLTGSGIVIQLEDSKEPVPPDGATRTTSSARATSGSSSKSCGGPVPRRSRSTASGSLRPRPSSTSGPRSWSTRPT